MTDASPESGRDYRETVFLPNTQFPMRGGLPKKEPEILARWAADELDATAMRRAADRPTFSFHDGPPYANGHIHMGTALNKILKDLVVRTKRMAGFKVGYVPGWDCHGLPIEWKVEEAYRGKGQRKEDVDAVEFRQACRAFAEGWIDVQRDEFKRLGVSGTWDRPYLTMDFAAEAAIVAEFLKFRRTGLVRRGSKPVMWSPVEQTALAEAEVEYHDHISPTIWVKFPITAYSGDPKTDVFTKSKTQIVIWTTTPWTIPGNRAIAYGPDIAYGLYEVIGRPEECWAQIGDRYVMADALAPEVFAQARLKGDGVDGLDPTMVRRLGDVSAAEIGAMTCAHPFRDVDPYWSFDVPLLSGDHVTDEAGTGFVHTAPSHGQEDYDVWLAHGLPDDAIPDMVDARGAYLADVPLFAGLEIIRTEGKKKGQEGGANKTVLDKLIEIGALLARGRLAHSYPHSWRSKAPLIFRNTPQWFIALDRPFALDGEAEPKTLRARALAEIDRVGFTPERGRSRIRPMVEGRPDWLISRQRAWGVPITLFVHRETGAVLDDPAVDARIIEAVRHGGADAWFATPAAALLGADHDAAEWERVEDILDVWFDSGSTHAFVLEGRDDGTWPADLYLEGSDQHRGWFQSSLLESCGTRGRAPYEHILTHGFVVDGQGRKMSKSLGNTVAPQDLVDKFGADILRLWTASVDYTEDLRFSDDAMSTAVDAYKKIRNTFRYLLGALDGFSERERVNHDDMPELERFVRHQLAVLDGEVRAAYAGYDFKRAFARLYHFCVVDLSALHFDVRKDSLYCDRPDAVRRRALRTVMADTLERLLRWFAPILCFTSEEAYGWSPLKKAAPSVHLTDFLETPEEWRDDALAARWAEALEVRRVGLGALETARRNGLIGAPLEAHVTLHFGDEDLAGRLSAMDWAELLIASQADVATSAAPPDAFALTDVQHVGVIVRRAEGRKCARSWRILPEVGEDPRYPDLSLRDADAVAAWDARRAAA